MSEEFETYDNTRPQEPQNGQPAGNAYNMSQGYGYGYGNQNAGANTRAYSNGYNTGANGYQDGNAANTGAYSNGYNAGAYGSGNAYNAPYNNQAPYNYPGNNYQYNNQPTKQNNGLSIASLVLGIVGIVACCIPIIGIPVNVTGLILGIVGMKKGGKGMAIAGIILCSIFLVLTIANSALGVYINMNYRDAYDFLDSLGIDYNY